MKVGVFDSGIGGLSVAQAIERTLPELEVQFVHDTPDHFPYATKQPAEIYSFVEPIMRNLIDQGCDAIVIACNTVSTTLAGRLRTTFPNTPFVAMEPMVKPAAEQSTSGIIAVCATPTTLASARYHWLKQQYAPSTTVLEPDCSDWSTLIEHDQMNEARIRADIEPLIAHGVDVIVLGCTHYHWIEQEIKAIVGKQVRVLQPEAATIKQLRRVLGLPL